MKKLRLLLPIFVVLGILCVCLPDLMGYQKADRSPQPSAERSTAWTTSSASPEVPSAPAIETVTYEVHQLPQSTVHLLRLPANAQVMPALATGVDTVANLAEANGSIAAVNGGFFDPVNQETTSYVVLNGTVVADPAQNQRLVNNPEMIPYLDRILDRSEFRQIQCGQTVRYEIANHRQPIPEHCQVLTAMGAGPRLLPQLALVEEGFAEVVAGQRVRDALGSTQPNARTAVGITDQQQIILVMAAQLPEAPTNSGLSLPDLAEFMQTIGVQSALNLDGGSSSALYYQGQTYYGKVDTNGDRVERPVKSVLLVSHSN